MCLDNLEGQLSDGGQVLCREAFSGAACILLEGHVQMPVKLVLYAPVPSCEHCVVRRVRMALIADVVPHGGGRSLWRGHGRGHLRNGSDAGPLGEDGLVLHALGGGYTADSLLHAPVAGLHLRRGVCDAPALKCVPDGLPEGRLVVLDGKEVVRVALQDALRDGRLGARGVDRHHSPFYVKPVEQAGDGRYLVLLVRDGLLART